MSLTGRLHKLMVLIQNQCFGMSGKIFVVMPTKAQSAVSRIFGSSASRARIFLALSLGLGFYKQIQGSGSDF